MEDQVDSCDNDKLSIKIEKGTMEQHMLLLNLKQQREELDVQIRQKIEVLNALQEKKINIEGNVQTRNFRTTIKGNAVARKQEAVAKAQKETNKIQKQIQKEKKQQLKDLKSYEENMNSLAQKLNKGPYYYERKNVTAEISILRNKMNGIAEELLSIEKELNCLSNKYGSLLKFSPDQQGLTGKDTLLEIITQLTEDKKKFDSEGNRKSEDIKNLSKVTESLREELKKLKQVHHIE